MPGVEVSDRSQAPVDVVVLSEDGSRSGTDPMQLEAGANNDAQASPRPRVKSFAAAVVEGAMLFERDVDIASRPCTALAMPAEDSPMKKSTGTTSKQLELVVVLVMVASGGVTSFLGGMFYQLSPAWSAFNSTLDNAHESQHDSTLANVWVTAFLVVFIFSVEGSCAALSPATRRALRLRSSRRMVLILMVPSGMDVLVTGLATIALAFAQPALVGFLKAGVQLITLAVATRFLQGKKQKWSQWICLLTVLLGIAILLLNVLVLGHGGHRFAPGNQAIGALIAILSGVIGAFRNLAEAAILDDDDMPPDALLCAESVLSVAIFIPLALLLGIVLNAVDSVRQQEALSNLSMTLAKPAAVIVAFGCALTAYGKDAGKFWMIKYTSAQRQKMLAVMFPFVTWALGLLVFYAGGRWHVPAFGAGFSPASIIELLGFAFIIGANITIVMLKDKASLAAVWCAKVDAACG